jgi:hypothetical protein
MVEGKLEGSISEIPEKIEERSPGTRPGLRIFAKGVPGM